MQGGTLNNMLQQHALHVQATQLPPQNLQHHPPQRQPHAMQKSPAAQNSRLAKVVSGASDISPTSVTKGHCARLNVLSLLSLLSCPTPASVMFGQRLIRKDVKPDSRVSCCRPTSVMWMQRSKCSVSKLSIVQTCARPTSVTRLQPLTFSVASCRMCSAIIASAASPTSSHTARSNPARKNRRSTANAEEARLRQKADSCMFDGPTLLPSQTDECRWRAQQRALQHAQHSA